MKQLFIAVGILALFALACGGTAEKTANDYVNEYGGNIDVYARILSLDDCDALQVEFDQADENLQLQSPGTPEYQWGIGYMKAADDRMIEIGCHS